MNQPASEPADDTRKVLVVNPADEPALRSQGEAMGLNVHVTPYGPDPGEVYLFDPAAIPPLRMEIQYLARPVPEGDPWEQMKREIIEGLRRPPAVKLTDVR